MQAMSKLVIKLLDLFLCYMGKARKRKKEKRNLERLSKSGRPMSLLAVMPQTTHAALDVSLPGQLSRMHTLP